LLCSRRKAHQGARSSQQMPDRTWTGAGGAAGRRQFPAVKGIVGAHRATGRSPAQRRSSARMRAALCVTTIVVHAASVAALHQAGGSGLRPPVLRVTGGGDALADPPVLRKIERGARTFLSGLTFSHITGLIRAGYEKPLEEEELPDLPDVDTAERHGASSRPRPPRRPSRAPHAATARRCQAADPRPHPDMRHRADPRGGLEGGRAGRSGAGAQQGPARGPHRPRPSRRGGLGTQGPAAAPALSRAQITPSAPSGGRWQSAAAGEGASEGTALLGSAGKESGGCGPRPARPPSAHAPLLGGGGPRACVPHATLRMKRLLGRTRSLALLSACWKVYGRAFMVGGAWKVRRPADVPRAPHRRQGSVADTLGASGFVPKSTRKALTCSTLTAPSWSPAQIPHDLLAFVAPTLVKVHGLSPSVRLFLSSDSCCTKSA